MDWKIFTTTFIALLIAELGDKTQLAVLTLTCKYQRPLPVFLGASIALASVTLLGVLGGEIAVRLVSTQILRKVAAVLFLVIGALMWFEIL
ncbi:MAG: TMEM165/GDT1 family protein [Chloroflexi bacterium]|nr:TMEM165/GDT1 family protein [Chloroflexota bacterium]